MTSSAIRPASRPTRVESSGTVPLEPGWLGRRRRVRWWYSGSRPPAGNWAVFPGSGAVARSTVARLWFLRVELLSRDIRLDEQPTRIGIGQRNDLSAAQPAIPLRLVVEAVCDRKRVVCPGEKADSVAHRPQQNRRVGDARQVQVSREILHDLLNRDVVTAPERYAIELHPQEGGGEAGHQ